MSWLSVARKRLPYNMLKVSEGHAFIALLGQPSTSKHHELPMLQSLKLKLAQTNFLSISFSFH
jgi:hypothetical protein